MLENVRRLDAQLSALMDKVDLLRVETATIKVKAGIYGILAGSVPALTLVVLKVMEIY